MPKIFGIRCCGKCGSKLQVPNVKEYDSALGESPWQCSECSYKSFYARSCFDLFEQSASRGVARIVPPHTSNRATV
jgi:DNA-directed RNA polymerase subunit RPC12/RpoP